MSIIKRKFNWLCKFVVAPILVGGSLTSTLIDGESITKVEELSKLKALKLIDVKKLNDSYVQLKYKVINNEQKNNVFIWYNINL